ncbi:hypothetical protein [Tenacibaculum halocynthiae]|uniref:hypothetical protein n=1 Tax=Tenacibaculum halocynthiae TaxID=1254437 RepID=UPI003D649722
MKPSILFIGLLVLLISCESKKQEAPIIKKEHFKEFTKTTTGKDSLILEYKIGYRSKGKQKYFLGIHGYNKPKDTTWISPKSDFIKKKSRNKTIIYNSKNEVQIINKKEGDTVFIYSPDYDDPVSYSLIDEKSITEVVDFFSRTKKQYTKRKFDENGNLTSYILNQTYTPNEYDKKYLSEGELLKKEAEFFETTKVKINYEYY